MFDKILYKNEDPHGPGEVYFIWQKGSTRSLLATTGSDGSVGIFNRRGQLVERLLLNGLCSGFCWDNEGVILGVITSSCAQITLWDSKTQKKHSIESGLRDQLSCIIWSKKSQIVAVGTSRGNLALYNHQNGKRTPILGKHAKRITCGAWSGQNILALGSDDKSFSLSNEEGDSIKVIQLRDVPSDMYFAKMANDEKKNEENALSMIIGKRTLFLYYIPEPDSPTELGFQTRYGSLLQHKWFGDGYILLGFSKGHIVAISTHPKEIGQELWQVKNHKENLTGLAHCPALDIVASCGDNTIKIHSITNLQETEKIITTPDHSGVKMIDWSSDGRLLAVTTSNGSIYTYVTKLPNLFAANCPKVAILSSLTEISIYTHSAKKSNTIPNKFVLEFEPTFIGISTYHLAAGLNNRIWLYDFSRTLEEEPILIGEHDFPSEIKSVELNSEFYAVLFDDILILRSINWDNTSTKEKMSQNFPMEIAGLNDVLITCHLLTEEFLIFATDIGHIVYFSVEKWSVCIKYRHIMGIKKISCDSEGTKLIFIDDHDDGYVFLPATEETVLISDFPKDWKGVLWDLEQNNIFITYNNKMCLTHVFVRLSIDGKHTNKIGETNLVSDHNPIMLCDGELALCVDSGEYASLTLSTHLITPGVNANASLDQLIQMKNYEEAFRVCEKMNSKDSWLKLGQQAIADLETELALNVYRQIGDAAMVYALNDIRYIEDINTLSGFCCMLLKQYEKAKELFLKSTNAREALDICRDLLQWDQALILAEKYDPSLVPYISREYGQQLEFTGCYADALYHYEKGYQEENINDSNNLVSHPNTALQLEEHIRLCKAGIARTSIRTGDFRRGIQNAIELNNKQLLYDCAELLAVVGHLTEAAGLYERGGFFDEACTHYISLKMWNKVNHILPNVKSTKLHALYAKAKESDGEFTEAIASFKISGDLDACVRIYLDHLCDPHSASEIVMETRSTESAKMLSKFYQKIGDTGQALQFLVMCGCVQEAFSLAQQHNQLKQYGELLERYENAKSSDYVALAHYFEKEKYTLLCGKYYFLANEFSKALKYLFKASAFSNDESQAISMAIDCVATSNNDQYANQLIEFLLGEVDGIPKDPHYLFRLYMARKQYKDAAKTAVIIANQEQIAGNYKSARDLLFSMYQELKRNNLSVSADMRHSLILLHRYSLVRLHVKLANHLLAARLLVQIAANISQFPEHIIPILTSTVIECHRAGLKKSSFTYASMLMRPDYRNKLDPRYSKKIESIVRKAPKGIREFKDEIDDETMECPICDANLPNMDVTCYNCKTTLPICIATGQHIIKTNMTSCPQCDFLCFRAEMEKILSETNECPMCGETVDNDRLSDVEDIRPYILTSS